MRPEIALLKDILSRPTAPRHEHRVRAVLQAAFDKAGIPWRLDAFGNLVARYRRGKGVPVAMAAHMDHPGFEIRTVSGTTAAASWEGQVPTFDLKGKRLALWSGDPRKGRIGSAVVLDGDGRRPRRTAGRMTLRVPEGTRPGDFGHADLVPFKRVRGRIVSKALDNTGGCAAIASAMIGLARSKAHADAVGLFTRSEENGFKGALGAIRARTLAKSRPLIVLECSKELPGAEMGKGPVIRVGDRLTAFDPDLAAALVRAAQNAQKRDKSFLFQRRLMDGGACEASAFTLAGYRAVCLAMPLGNYHNVGAKGLEPEFVAERDYLNCVKALGIFASAGVDPAAERARLRKLVLGRLSKRDASLLCNTA